MLQFKLIREEFNKLYQEQQWTYSLSFSFTLNYQIITRITITDHYQENHSEITNELILNIITQLNNHIVEPTDYEGSRQAFVEEIYYSKQPYLVVFWWEDNHSDWLWIRNCYPNS